MLHIQLWECKGCVFTKVVLNNSVAKFHSAVESNVKFMATFWDLLL